jgi:hypothetical protein
MENIQKNYLVKSFALFFILISIFHIFFASCSCRGMYLDPSVFLCSYLDNFSLGNFSFNAFTEHPRQVVLFLSSFPIYFTGFVFRNFNSKIGYAIIYSFSFFTLPILTLWWNYELTKRTKQYAILFWSVFIYATTILLYQIFAIVETGIGVPLQFVLINYLFGDIHYSKWDKLGIAFLIIVMFGVYEHTILVGFLMFLATFFCLSNIENPKDVMVKIIIGAGSLAASCYTFFFALLTPSEHEDGKRFIKEMFDFLPIWHNLNFVVWVYTIIIILALAFLYRKKPLSIKMTALLTCFYIYIFIHMQQNIQIFLNPVFEAHTRGIILWLFPLIIIGLIIYKYKNNHENQHLINVLYIPVLLCGMVLTSWGIVNTFYWNKNIDYMKNMVENTNTPLCFPPENDKNEISSFWNENSRRYIWNSNFVSTALIFYPDYKVKTILMHYDNKDNKDYGGNFIRREALFAIPEKNIMGIPYTEVITTKNKFWDITVPAKALSEYNKKHKIKTLENDEGTKQKIEQKIYRMSKQK